ncbi:DUF480 domain-containing protein [Desulfonema ishimotonii]|uniref:DUF480 domain-containing protein n=1 Tax=Desulfonema ishimotonii TaxID=45657 RepID=A0A401G4N5_9BACT|nr:YceH family protein [Desulfonema ishimotonii]GBC64095.1 DUF480 domain-containing protein [Desulfonema ishimotonii]
MEIVLDAVEARILGALIEKEMTTPDYYPLTLNTLINACNQKSNRQPVMALDEEMVSQAIDHLRQEKLIWQVRTAGSRVAKYDHNIKDVAEFSKRDVAVLCVLLLRGPQTMGEIRNRTARLYEFNGLNEVERTLDGLMTQEEGPFVVRLSRQAGRKEPRYAHLFCGEVQAEDEETEVVPVTVVREDSRLDALEAQVEALESELEALKRMFSEFKAQFE